jgi:hypothetical protein
MGVGVPRPYPNQHKAPQVNVETQFLKYLITVSTELNVDFSTVYLMNQSFATPAPNCGIYWALD